MMVRLLILLLCCYSGVVGAQNPLPLHLLKLPPGFHVSVYARDVDGARSMTLGDRGTVFVGSIGAGKVYAILPEGTDNARVLTVASGLNMPNGVTFYKGALYVAEKDQVLKFENIEANLASPQKPTVISKALPDKSHHGWRYMKVGPDGKLYIGIGAPCNNCLRDDTRFASIARLNMDGSHFEIYAKGVRNTVGFAWDPTTKNLWFTDNSRDWMGDNLPPDELNYAPKGNLHFGFPYCHGKNVSDPEFGTDYPCSAFMPPQLELPAHVAALGMIFYTGNMFPSNYKNQIFIAEHGSWNRSSKVGYQVISVKLDGNNIGAKPFVTGWLQHGEPWGRPVDVLMLKDGSLLVSDDYANVIYRITYNAHH